MEIALGGILVAMFVSRSRGAHGDWTAWEVAVDRG